MTGLNALKPVHMDDPTYLRYAREFANHPLKPYDFLLGSPNAAPANDLLVPPVLPYWLGLGTRLAGDNPVLLKMWLFPFPLAFAAAIHVLASRWAPSMVIPLIWSCLLSSTLLPGFNCMLEVPVLALILSALAVGVIATENGSWKLMLLAGLLSGLAIQTKYTGAVSVVALLIWYALQRRPWQGLAIGCLAVTLAFAWECFVAYSAGESHFLVAYHQRQGGMLGRCLHLVLPLLSHVSGLGGGVALFALTALGCRPKIIAGVGIGIATGFVVLAMVPSQEPLLRSPDGLALLTPSNLIYGFMAVPVWGALIGVAVQLMRIQSIDRSGPCEIDWFLLLWLGAEVAIYFGLSPWPAARRVAGIMLVVALMAGRLAHRQGIPARSAGTIAGISVGLAGILFAIDWVDALAATKAASVVANQSASYSRRCWHISWWGFSYYANRAGLAPLQINRERPLEGDLLAVLEGREDALKQFPTMELEHVNCIAIRDAFPLQVSQGYYGGRTPVENLCTARARVFLYRIKRVSD